MSVQRHRSPVTITTVPRSTLTHAHHKGIDAILKDLRVCSRRLKSALDNFMDEMRTLERLYYKCKNQHRVALHFKRVSEIRRYGWRLSELDIAERVSLLRASFVGLEHTNDQKALRGSWSRLPEKPHVYFLIERLTACSTLVCKMRERLENAYHHFTLAMQTGAFVQLIILFVAMSSRMSVLSSELEDALQLSLSACHRLLAIIHSSQHAVIHQQSPSDLEPSLHSSIDHDVPPEDTEQRSEPIDTSASVVEGSGMQMGATLDTQVMPHPSRPENAGDNTIARASKRATEKAAQKTRVKKAKKKFDEIDEIFGF